MPKIVDHEERRQEIGAAAAGLIAERGIDAVTMAGIADAAGVTTGAVTHYFTDKDEVILAALRWADGAMQLRSRRALAEHHDVATMILAALPSNEQSRLEWIVWVVFADRATRSRALMAEKRRRDREWHQLAVSVFEEMQAEGKLDPDVDIETEACLAVATIDGIGFHAAWDPTSWPEDKQRRIINSFLARLAPTPYRAS